MKVFVRTLVALMGGAMLQGSLTAESDVTAFSPARNAEQFDADLRKQLYEEYRLCSGDTAPVTISHILRWRQNFTSAVNDTLYRAILAAYRAERGSEAPTTPCLVFNWHLQRSRSIQNLDSGMMVRQYTIADTLMDSLYVLSEMAACTPGAADFQTLPFGLTLRSVRYYFHTKKSLALVYEYPYLYTRNYRIHDELFTLALHFNPAGYFYKYEFESRDAPLDSLDTRIRHYAKVLTDHFRDKLGAPSAINTVNRSEIKSGSLSIMARWEIDSTSVAVGIGTWDDRYYAKALASRHCQYPVNSNKPPVMNAPAPNAPAAPSTQSPVLPENQPEP